MMVCPVCRRGFDDWDVHCRECHSLLWRYANWRARRRVARLKKKLGLTEYVA